jgi:hypothetical protein
MNKALYNKFIVLLTSRLLQTNTVFMFCTTKFVLGGTEEVGTRLHVLRSRTHFGRYRGRRAQFSYFVLADSFGAVPRASGPVFMFFTPELIFGGTDGIGSHFHFFASELVFDDTEGVGSCFLCFALPGSFGAKARALGHVFKFYAPGLILDGTEGTWPCFHVLRYQNRLVAYQGR